MSVDWLLVHCWAAIKFPVSTQKVYTSEADEEGKRVGSDVVWRIDTCLSWSS